MVEQRRRLSSVELARDPDKELDQPFEDVVVTDMKHPFPEAVVAEPTLAARRQPGTFDNDSLEDFYVPIERYEGRHRYDPKFTWDPSEEKRLVRKVLYRRFERHEHLLTFLPARLENLHLVLFDVLCTTTRSRQHRPSSLGLYA